MMPKHSKIYVAGHRGLLGSALARKLTHLGYTNLLLRTSSELNLLDQAKTYEFLESERPEFVVVCAAKVGGIQANIDNIGQFLFENLQIQNNLIEGARRSGVAKLIFVASTCIYPTTVDSPIKEEMILAGPIEPTNEGYGLAKIAGVKMCQYYRRQYGCNFISAIPCNLFGISDHYDPKSSHVLQATIRKVHAAKQAGAREIEIWGSGRPRREFMLSDDCADALVFLMNHYDGDKPVNVGVGTDYSITELAQITSKVLGWEVALSYNTSKPDGIFRKLADTSYLQSLGWRSGVSLEEGIRVAYDDFLRQEASRSE